MNNSYWLSSVEMGGYRTIKNVSVSFQPGLNIVIGKNGTGKTNFFEFLYNTLQMKFAGVSEFHTNLHLFYEGNEIEIKVKGETVKKTGVNDRIKSRLSAELKQKGEENKRFSRLVMENSEDVYLSDLQEFLYEKQIDTTKIEKINYGLPQNIVMLNMSGFWNSKEKQGVQYRVNSITGILIKLIEKYKENGQYNLAKIRDNFPTELDTLYNSINVALYRKSLQAYTQIQDVRFNHGILILEKENSIEFSNIIFEFKIHNDWFFFNDLSDGTKRLVWIIYAFLYSDSKLFLLEEPELGIHPHQLNLLMKFLKEQSAEKQIILSTHAPQCLDILEPDELDRIIICEMEGKSTKLSHLTEEKKAKAKRYMEETDILSNYWRFSDLEA